MYDAAAAGRNLLVESDRIHLRKKETFIGSEAKSSGLSRSKMSLNFDTSVCVSLIFAVLCVSLILRLASVKWSSDPPCHTEARDWSGRAPGRRRLAGEPLTLLSSRRSIYLLFRLCPEVPTLGLLGGGQEAWPFREFTEWTGEGTVFLDSKSIKIANTQRPLPLPSLPGGRTG